MKLVKKNLLAYNLTTKKTSIPSGEEMTNPTRCISSHVTTFLLENFRNPQGGEQNWVNREEDPNNIDNIYVYLAKVGITEVAVSLLCVSATIESVAYGILILGSFPLSFLTFIPFSSTLLDYSVDLFSSSSFTILWNVGNAVTFNPFCMNTVTHESFARFSIDHWPRGILFQLTISVMIFSLNVFSALNGEHVFIHSYDRLISNYTRDIDSLYIADWCRENHLNTQFFGNLDARLTDFISHGRETNSTIERGKNFIRDHLFNDGQVDAQTRDLILERDSEAYIFALTRLIYVSVFSERNASVDFFKSETRLTINDLRAQYSLDQGNALAQSMKDLNSFNQAKANAPRGTLLNRLEGAANNEQRVGTITRCFQDACQEYTRLHPATA
jgi:hypothetical protein